MGKNGRPQPVTEGGFSFFSKKNPFPVQKYSQKANTVEKKSGQRWEKVGKRGSDWYFCGTKYPHAITHAPISGRIRM
jgi:hypothetical protein